MAEGFVFILVEPVLQQIQAEKVIYPAEKVITVSGHLKTASLMQKLGQYVCYFYLEFRMEVGFRFLKHNGVVAY